MMKIISCAFFLAIVCGCNQPDMNKGLQTRIDSLESALAKTYKPGLGEFMTSIQIHHEKLWFAGENQNWKLADFEATEIEETLQDINDYCSDRPEVQSITMIDPALDSMKISIQMENLTAFKNGFVLLTNSCNKCHKETNHDFNVIKIPETPPFSNQEF